MANPAGPTAEEMLRPDVVRPSRHPAEVAKREAARKAAEELREELGYDEDDWAREALHERESFKVFMQSARIFGEGGSDDEWGGEGRSSGGPSEGLAMTWGCP